MKTEINSVKEGKQEIFINPDFILFAIEPKDKTAPGKIFLKGGAAILQTVKQLKETQKSLINKGFLLIKGTLTGQKAGIYNRENLSILINPKEVSQIVKENIFLSDGNTITTAESETIKKALSGKEEERDKPRAEAKEEEAPAATTKKTSTKKTGEKQTQTKKLK